MGQQAARGQGLIPAHAGKTRSGRREVQQRRAHPRSRGENSQAEEALRPRTGSSPLTRGKLVEAGHAGAKCGLIPAHAGKTLTPAGRLVIDGGSSPLTRGKLDGAGPVGVGLGLIPAHAGKTRHMLIIFLMTRAHPRSRGENLIVTCARASAAGSSPLTRGKHQE